MAFQEHPRVWERSQDPAPGFWGRRRGAARPGRPWAPRATYWLLGAMAATFVLQLAVDEYVRSRLGAFFAGAGPYPGIVWDGILRPWSSFLFAVGTDWGVRPWSVVTSTFAHGGFGHIAVNALFLFFMGPSVERLVGARRYLAVFLAGGAVSGVAQVHLVAWTEAGVPFHPDALALGASGAIMAVFGILVALTPRARVFFMVFPMPMWVAGIAYAALDVLGVFNPASNVGHFAHLSGMALGLGYGLWARRDLRRRGLRIVHE